MPQKSMLTWNTILAGDCIAGMAKLPAKSVHLAFADPPFNIGYDYDVYDDRQGHQQYLDWSRKWIAGVHRVLQPDGTFWLAIGDEYAAELKLISQKVGFHCRSWVIWYYTFGVNCSRKFSRSHAHLFHFIKDPVQFTFREEELENRIPSARQLVYNDKRANPSGRLPDDTWIIRPQEVVGELLADDGSWSPSDVQPQADDSQTWTLRPQDLESRFQPSEDTWYFPRVAGTFKERAGFHGCQMPEQLLGRIIRFCSREGETVMDPFSGSATTLVVAKKLGRQHVGFELSDEYVKHGLSRLSEVRLGDRLSGSPEPTMSAPETFTGKETGRGKKNSLVADKQAPTLESRYEQAQLELTLRGVRAAFELTYQGFSADRVVADPELNAEFQTACARLGIVGDAKVWNTLLFRLRKAGQLAQLPATRTTAFSWTDCNAFLFACEIAWQALLDANVAGSLDEILCDPQLALQFDALAGRLAPGYSSLQYRWGALKLRKQVKVARTRGSLLSIPKHGVQELPVDELDFESLPDTAGVYLLTAGRSQHLYAGEAIYLRQRLQAQLGSPEAHNWGTGKKPLRLQWWATTAESNSPLAWQACFVRRYQPKFNLKEFMQPTSDM